MGNYKTKKFKQSLEKKGFNEEEEKHHKYYRFYWKNKLTTIYTYISHSERDFGEDLFNKRKKQLKLKEKSEMEDFYNCPMTKKDYSDYLINIEEIEE